LLERPFRLQPPRTRHIHVARPPGSSAANIGNPADVSPQAGEGFQTDASRFPSPRSGEGADCRRRSACEQRSWPEGERQDGASQADGGNRG